MKRMKTLLTLSRDERIMGEGKSICILHSTCRWHVIDGSKELSQVKANYVNLIMGTHHTTRLSSKLGHGRFGLL